MTSTRGSNQHSASFSFPASLGCTPSPVMVSVSKPVQQSTTVTGLPSVDTPGAHSATASFSATVRSAHSGHVGGLTGMICAIWEAVR